MKMFFDEFKLTQTHIHDATNGMMVRNSRSSGSGPDNGNSNKLEIVAMNHMIESESGHKKCIIL